MYTFGFKEGIINLKPNGFFNAKNFPILTIFETRLRDGRFGNIIPSTTDDR